MASDTVSYECFDELIASLRREGFPDEADRLHLLLHEVVWTTGSELLGEPGQAINKIEQVGSLKRSASTVEKIEECFRMIFRVWPDFPRTK
jgi:hypothetical protein